MLFRTFAIHIALDLMMTSYQNQQEALARFESMQKNAGVMLLLWIALAGISIALFMPSAWFVIGCLLAGALVFACWRAAIARKDKYALVLAILFIAVALGAQATEIERPLPVLLSMGLPLICVGLYVLLHFAKGLHGRTQNEIQLFSRARIAFGIHLLSPRATVRIGSIADR